MRFSWEYLVAGPALILSLLLGWFAGVWLKLQGGNFWILFIGVAALAVTGIGGWLWWSRSRSASKPAGGGADASPAASAAPAAAPDDIHLLIREAESRVASARLGGGAKLANLPAIFVLGEGGSGKTSTVIHCGLEPELLAGQVYQEGAVVPTRSANFWFARKTVFVEAGPKLIADPRLWTQLLKRLVPGKLQSVVGSKQQAPRAAVVCFDCEKFVKSAAPEAVAATARNLRARLEEMSHLLGISFPIYVFFNKADRVPFFDDFARNLTNEEGTQVLGVTLPILVGQTTGVYAEQETKRLTTAFNSLFYSLADCRPGLLAREHDADKQPGVYEFPRQFRKFGPSAVQFLVDLCRPSHLRTGPFLRGFYFTGQRAVTTSVTSPTVMATRTMLGQTPSAPANATTMLRPEDVPAMGGWQTGTQIQGAGTRQTTQSLFLSHIFSHVLLQDRAALGASGASTRLNFLRRMLLATASAVGLVLIVGFLVSYFSNRALENQVRRAAQALPANESPATQLASTDALQRLDTLRQSLEELRGYQKEGAPWHLRWGLYVGADLLPEARQIYFDRFCKVLFCQTQVALPQWLRTLPAAPRPADEYGSAYDTLKAYLITTSNPDRCTRDFLSPFLMRKWAADSEVEPNRRSLAQEQFDFYCDELRIENPYSSANDVSVVERTRRYLGQFAATQRIYQAMRFDASKKNPAISFGRKFPEAADVLRNNREVEGAFTKTGWAFMQDAIRHPDRYFKGEEWVLGQSAGVGLDPAKLQQDLLALYQADFIRQWREFLNNTLVLRAGTIPEAARKVGKHSSNQAPLLELLCQVSLNTDVDSPEVKRAFQPPQFVVPPACQNQYVLAPNQSYISALLKLQACWEQAASAPPEQKEAARQQCSGTAASEARVAVRQIAQNFIPDQENRIDKTVQKLMEDTILIPGPPIPPGPGNAQELCAHFRVLMNKFPFNPNSGQQAALEEINGWFAPSNGAFSKFYQEKLKNILTLQGGRYLPNPTSPIKLNPAFVDFFNRAARVQQTLYPDGSPQPHFEYQLRQAESEGIQSLTLRIDGRTYTWPKGSTAATQFAWPGTGAQEARLSAKITGGSELDLLNYDGLWAVFHLFADADKSEAIGPGYRMEWLPRISGQFVRSQGKPVKVQLDVDAKGAPPIFQRGYFSSLSCVPKVTR